MVKLTKISDFSSLKDYRLCFINNSTVNIGGVTLNSDFDGLLLWFSENPLLIKSENKLYSCTTCPPVVNEEFYLLYIKNYFNTEFDGIEIRKNQKDNWIASYDLYRCSPITVEKINRGAGCWLFNEETNEVLNSKSTISDVLKTFSDYKIELYNVNIEKNS